MDRLKGKVAVITGAARGQGEAAARLFAAEGAQVVLTDVLDTEGLAVAASIGRAATYLHLDVTSEQEWNDAVTRCVEHFGAPTVLVNNAGIFPGGSIVDCDQSTFRRTLDVNVLGPFLGMKAVVPAMTAAGRGSIINISSAVGIIARAGCSAYVTSKWALRGLTKSAALEFGQFGVRVNSVHPGPVDTAMTSEESMGLTSIERDKLVAGLPIARWGRPEEIAQLVLFLASDESSFSTGSEFIADGGRSAGGG